MKQAKTPTPAPMKIDVKIFMAKKDGPVLANASVNIRMIDQGSSELNIIVGVDANDYVTALKAIYDEFVREN